MAKAPHHTVRALAAVAERLIGDMGDHVVARQMQNEITRLSKGAAALDSVFANRSPLETEGAHMVKVAGMARKFDREITAAMNRISEVYREGERDLQRRIDEKVNLKPDAFAEEIRAAFRSLDSRAKLKLLHELADANRGPELAAIVRAPVILTGIAEEHRARFEEAILAKHAPAELAERAGLASVFEEGFAATSIAAGAAKAFTDPGKLAQIEREAESASVASEAFNQSLQ